MSDNITYKKNKDSKILSVSEDDQTPPSDDQTPPSDDQTPILQEKDDEYSHIQHSPRSNKCTYKDLQDNNLIFKLNNKINTDLLQINSIYEKQIKDTEQKKKEKIFKIEKEYNLIIDNINNNRQLEISEYKKKAELCIDNINSLKNNSWYNYFF